MPRTVVPVEQMIDEYLSNVPTNMVEMIPEIIDRIPGDIGDYCISSIRAVTGDVLSSKGIASFSVEVSRIALATRLIAKAKQADKE